MKRLNDLVNHLISPDDDFNQTNVLLSSNIVNSAEIDFSDLNLYEFEETKKLVLRVKNAAKMIGEKGEAAFPELRTDPWYTNSDYIFVADLTGLGMVNPPAPELEGKNVLQLKDSWGTHMIKQYLEELTVHNKQAAWVHYFGINPATNKEDWKSSFVMKARSPGGTEYAVGSGIYNMKMERILVGEDIQKTCELIDKEGLGAINQLIMEDYFRDTFSFLTK